MEALQKLGIDFLSILIHLVNFGILIGVLTKFLYRPTKDFLEKRQKTIEDNLHEAERIKNTFQEEFSKKEKETAKKMAQLDADIAAQREQAEKHAHELIAEAEMQKEKLMKEAKAVISEMKEDLHDTVEAEVLKRIEKTVLAVLKDSVSPEVVQKNIAKEWELLKQKV